MHPRREAHLLEEKASLLGHICERRGTQDREGAFPVERRAHLGISAH
jgi:hypothetical protein